MNGFPKNKNGTTKRNVKPEITNDQLGENAPEQYNSEKYTKGEDTKKNDK